MNYRTKETDYLFEVIARLNSKQECYDFFEDLCTIKEILDMSKRLEAANLLIQNKSYDDIIKKIGISSATLSRVSNSLNYGSGGYKKSILKVKKKLEEN